MGGMKIKEALRRAPDGFTVEGTEYCEKDQDGYTLNCTVNTQDGEDSVAGYEAYSVTARAYFLAAADAFVGATDFASLLSLMQGRVAVLAIGGSGIDFINFSVDGDIRFIPANLAESLRLNADGNMGFNTPDQFGGGKGVIAIKNAGTNPNSNPTNATILYSDGGELKVRDASGNVTTLSPHPLEEMNETDPENEPLPGFYYSENKTIGKRVVINLTKLAGLVQTLFPKAGNEFIKYVNIGKKSPSVDERKAWKDAWKKANASEVVITEQEALETYEEKRSKELPTFTEKYVLDKKTGEVKAKMVKDKEVITKTRYRIKEGVRLDGETGEFKQIQYPSDAEADAAADSGFTPVEQPQWIQDRLS